MSGCGERMGWDSAARFYLSVLACSLVGISYAQQLKHRRRHGR